MHYPCPNSHDATSTTPFLFIYRYFPEVPISTMPAKVCKWFVEFKISNNGTSTLNTLQNHDRYSARNHAVHSVRRQCLVRVHFVQRHKQQFENLLPLRAPGLPRSRTLLQLLPSWALWSRRQADLWTTMRRWMWAPHHHLLSWHRGTRKVKWSEGLVWFRCWRRIPSPPPCGCRGASSLWEHGIWQTCRTLYYLLMACRIAIGQMFEGTLLHQEAECSSEVVMLQSLNFRELQRSYRNQWS